MRYLINILVVVMLLLSLWGCFDDAQEPQPKPKSPPPTQQVGYEDLSD